MPDANELADKFLAALEKGIDERLREQLARYRRASVPINTKAVIDQVFEQRKEELLKDRGEWEDNEQDALIDFFEWVTHEHFHELREQFYNRYR